MACSVSYAATSPGEFYRASENRGSDVRPEEENIETLSSENASSAAIEDSNKDLKSRVIVVLSNTTRNIAVVETVRFLAIVGLVCSAAVSVLLPALGFAAIATGACVWKNRVIQLDAKNPQGLDAIVEEVADPALSRSPSMRSQNSAFINDSIGRSRGVSVATNIMSSISEETPEKAEIVLGIKEAFLDSLEGKSRESLRSLLGICYSSLSKKIKQMPEFLNKDHILGRTTKAYLGRKQQAYSPFSGLTEDLVNKKQKLLEEAKPSLVMEIIKELYTQISQEEKKFGHKEAAKNYAKNAEHAQKYIDQLQIFELQKDLHFTEDVN